MLNKLKIIGFFLDFMIATEQNNRFKIGNKRSLLCRMFSFFPESKNHNKNLKAGRTQKKVISGRKKRRNRPIYNMNIVDLI